MRKLVKCYDTSSRTLDVTRALMEKTSYEAIAFTVEEIEVLFYALCDGYHHGYYDLDIVKVGLETLGVFDEHGVIWMIGVNSGKWYRWDGTEWIQGIPKGYLYQAYEYKDPKTDNGIDLTNPIMKQLLKKA